MILQNIQMNFNNCKVLSNGMQIPEIFNFVSSTHFIYQFALMDGMIAVFVYLSNEHTMNQKDYP